MDRTWKVYGISVVLVGLLFGSPTDSLNACSSYEPTVLSPSIPSVQSAGPEDGCRVVTIASMM